jgi:hypothetical protein
MVKESRGENFKSLEKLGFLRKQDKKDSNLTFLYNKEKDIEIYF